MQRDDEEGRRQATAAFQCERKKTSISSQNEGKFIM
jgi:hypothetical protein